MLVSQNESTLTQHVLGHHYSFPFLIRIMAPRKCSPFSSSCDASCWCLSSGAPARLPQSLSSDIGQVTALFHQCRSLSQRLSYISPSICETMGHVAEALD